MIWQWKRFVELTAEELYQIVRLREQVFVVEQNCAYQDSDGHDPYAWHLLGMQDGLLVAYLRGFAPGYKYPEAALGRVVTGPSVRGTGVGRELLRVGIDRVRSTFATSSIRISAQAHLEKFYGEFGFRHTGKEYLEDNIPHIEMLLA